MIPSLGEAGGEWLSLLVVIVVVFVALPTVGMYREASAHSPRPGAWTAGMCVASAGVPVLGSLLVWLLYTSVEVGR